MIHYHGTPIGGKREHVTTFLQGRHALIPWSYQDDIGIALEVCQTIMVDNGAFTAWSKGTPVSEWTAYYEWCESIYRHPAFDFAVIPDVIDGSEEDNDSLLKEWPKHIPGAPVFHFHESLDRAKRLASEWPIICLGSSGQWPTPGTDSWWNRMSEIMEVICDKHGRPLCPIHGLRMLNPEIFTRIPLRSADSTNAAQNNGMTKRFGMYPPPTSGQRARVIAERIEYHQSASHWDSSAQLKLFSLS